MFGFDHEYMLYCILPVSVINMFKWAGNLFNEKPLFFNPTPLQSSDCKLQLTNIDLMLAAKGKKKTEKLAAKGDTKANNVKLPAEANWY